MEIGIGLHMIVEYTWSEQELLRKKCFKCDWLKLNKDDMWDGKCECPNPRIQNRYRSITDKCCSQKSIGRRIKND